MEKKCSLCKKEIRNKEKKNYIFSLCFDNLVKNIRFVCNKCFDLFIGEEKIKKYMPHLGDKYKKICALCYERVNTRIENYCLFTTVTNEKVDYYFHEKCWKKTFRKLFG